jgi:hypothetical protein
VNHLVVVRVAAPAVPPPAKPVVPSFGVLDRTKPEDKGLVFGPESPRACLEYVAARAAEREVGARVKLLVGLLGPGEVLDVSPSDEVEAVVSITRAPAREDEPVPVSDD